MKRLLTCLLVLIACPVMAQDLGSGDEYGLIEGGGGSAGGPTAINMDNDTPITYGTTTLDVNCQYQTDDANAFVYVCTLDVSDDANNVPVFVWGEETGVLNTDMGLFDGIVEPAIAVVNIAADAFVSLDAGDINGTELGLNFKPASDEDVKIVTIGVTEVPTIIWDDSETAFAFSSPIGVPNGTAGAPGLSFNGDDGIFATSGGLLRFTISGSQVLTMASGNVSSGTSNAWALLHEAGTLTNPSVLGWNNDLSSGLGGASGQPAIIASGVTGYAPTGSGGVITALISALPQISVPATCTLNEMALDTDVTVELCFCTSTDTWACWSVTTADGPTD